VGRISHYMFRWIIYSLSMPCYILHDDCCAFSSWYSTNTFRPRSAYFIIRTIQLVFSAGTVFFSHNNSARTMFFSQFSQVSASRTGPILLSTWKNGTWKLKLTFKKTKLCFNDYSPIKMQIIRYFLKYKFYICLSLIKISKLN